MGSDQSRRTNMLFKVNKVYKQNRSRKCCDYSPILNHCLSQKTKQLLHSPNITSKYTYEMSYLFSILHVHVFGLGSVSLNIIYVTCDLLLGIMHKSNQTFSNAFVSHSHSSLVHGDSS